MYQRFVSYRQLHTGPQIVGVGVVTELGGIGVKCDPAYKDAIVSGIKMILHANPWWMVSSFTDNGIETRRTMAVEKE
jgi:hypothetical protein